MIALETHMSLPKSLTAAAFALSLLAVSASHADVYRYVDKDGHVQYTDKPETLPAELLAKLKSNARTMRRLLTV
jgi:hypothetical protein